MCTCVVPYWQDHTIAVDIIHFDTPAQPYYLCLVTASLTITASRSAERADPEEQ